MSRSHFHDASVASQNAGNALGDRAAVRHTRHFRMYESGNAMKGILGHGDLVWATDPSLRGAAGLEAAHRHRRADDPAPHRAPGGDTVAVDDTGTVGRGGGGRGVSAAAGDWGAGLGAGLPRHAVSGGAGHERHGGGSGGGMGSSSSLAATETGAAAADGAGGGERGGAPPASYRGGAARERDRPLRGAGTAVVGGAATGVPRKYPYR